jgi:hypothetical protein
MSFNTIDWLNETRLTILIVSYGTWCIASIPLHAQSKMLLLIFLTCSSTVVEDLLDFSSNQQHNSRATKIPVRTFPLALDRDIGALCSESSGLLVHDSSFLTKARANPTLIPSASIYWYYSSWFGDLYELFCRPGYLYAPSALLAKQGYLILQS